MQVYIRLILYLIYVDRWRNPGIFFSSCATSYSRININANSPALVYPKVQNMDAEANSEILLNCARRIPKINFVDQESGLVYASMESARLNWIDPEIMNRKLDEEEARAGLIAIAPRLLEEIPQIESQQARPVSEEICRHTIGDLS